jgi:DNA-binding FadR family transcriptional regulator
VPLQTVESRRLYRQIAEQISTLIDRREFPVGSRLPAERELAVLLGVSRTSVREAIIALELAGRVEVRVGTGIFVLGPRADPKRGQGDATMSDDAPGPFDVLAARALLEGETAALAARNARKADIVALREQIGQMREHEHHAKDRDDADRRFHMLIAEMTGNSALPLAVANLWALRGGEIWTRIEAYFHTPVLRAKTLTDHEAIVAALEVHDAEGAREAMRRHLRRVAREFQRRWEETSGGMGRGAERRELTGSRAGGTVPPPGPSGTSTSGPSGTSLSRPIRTSTSRASQDFHRRARAPARRHRPTRIAKRIEHRRERASARPLHKPGGDS